MRPLATVPTQATLAEEGSSRAVAAPLATREQDFRPLEVARSQVARLRRRRYLTAQACLSRLWTHCLWA